MMSDNFCGGITQKMRWGYLDDKKIEGEDARRENLQN